ncbi:hypothetical protein N7V09_21340 [Shewanella seohaensis]|nr:hypothetical protein [Shewanella seohaensis]UXM82145.1 hypothetical protein N7V09_21340 [Shewanella seohaensis]
MIATRGRQHYRRYVADSGRWLKLIAPGLIDKITRKAIASGH